MSLKTKNLSAAIEIFDQEIEGVIRKIPLHSISPSRKQPRKNKEINIEALADSLKQDGLLQPILVTGHKGSYTIIAGERRYRAALSLKWTDIECRILDKNEQETYKLAVVENLQRENLDPLEESLAYKKLKQQFNYSDSDLAGIIGKSRNYISEILSIAEIPQPTIRKASKEGIVSKNILIQLAQAVKKDVGNEFIQKFQSGNISTVRAAKEYLYEVSNQNKSQILPEDPPKIEQHTPSHESTFKLKKTEAPTGNDKLMVHIEKNEDSHTLEILIHTPPIKFNKFPTHRLKEELRKTINAIISNHYLD